MDKEAVIKHIQQRLEEGLTLAQGQVASLQESLGAESKSTAGDKHETGRAMIQREMDQAAKSEARAVQALHQFGQMSEQDSGTKAGPGSLVKTQKGWFYLGLALGKLDFDGELCYAISLASPMGQAINGMRAGDEAPFQSGQIQILNVS